MVQGAGITEWPLIRGRLLLRTSFPARRWWHVWACPCWRAPSTATSGSCRTPNQRGRPCDRQWNKFTATQRCPCEGRGAMMTRRGRRSGAAAVILRFEMEPAQWLCARDHTHGTSAGCSGQGPLYRGDNRALLTLHTLARPKYSDGSSAAARPMATCRRGLYTERRTLRDSHRMRQRRRYPSLR